MPNIPGATNILPSVVSDVVTQSRSMAIPGGSRIPAMIGEGSTSEVIVSQAQGGGLDGLDPTYTSTTGADGRHFRLGTYPVISNRTTLYKNGLPLVGLESTISSSTFSNRYDYRIDITTGKIELQTAHLVDNGGYYTPVSTNVGIGVLNNLSLVDANAQPEIWTVRCISVQRTALNVPIAGTAKFIAIGSISGAKLNSSGNPYIWTANNTVVSNTILSFSIQETSTPFREGDAFTIEIASGVLVRSDSLTATYIPTATLNDPVLLLGMSEVVARHGVASVDNNLSLGAQLTFSNNSPSLMTVQAAPPMPRRTSYVLSDYVYSTSTNDDDFIFPLPVGVTPDLDASIHFFITNNSTNVETQILPNKLDYYTLDTAGYPTTHAFIIDNTAAPSGYSYYYTVVSEDASLNSGYDGYIGRDTAYDTRGVFSSSVEFDSTYVGKTLKIIDADNTANIGSYLVSAVVGGDLHVTHYNTAIPSVEGFDVFTNETTITFSVIDAVTGLAIDGYSDGYLTKIGTTATGTFGSNKSTGLDFSTISQLVDGYYNLVKLQITTTTNGNNGLYDITSYNAGANTIVIKKVLVNETDMRYEVIDTTDTSQYIVINKNVVPLGYGLRVTIVNSKDASFYDAGWITALESLETVECDILVPLPKQTISVIFQNSLSHCKAMSNIRNKKERILFIGAINGLLPANVTGTSLAAVEDIGVLEGIQGDNVTEVLAGNIEDLANYSVSAAFGNTYRCVYFYPDQIVVQAGADNVTIDGFYIAAAAAGYLAADVNIQNPLTNKTLSGFSILSTRRYSTTVLEQLAAAGITTLQPVSGGGKVVWGITTSQSGYTEEQEISIVFIRDRVAKNLRSGFEGYIGTAETPDTQAILNTRAIQLLNSLVSQGLITAYADVVVQRDSVVPTQWNVTCSVQPPYPINWIYIKVALGQL